MIVARKQIAQLGRLLACAFVLGGLATAQTPAPAGNGPVYVLLWFDTEDYLEPSSDDAALRIAGDLERLGVHATFKVVGEKARVLEKRNRTDVVRALSRHDIGYHTNTHSIHPAPAEYLRWMNFESGAREFVRRERPGVEDMRRIFGVTPTCYGQPGSSWAPQTNAGLRELGIPVYLDEGIHVGLNQQPFWYGGILYMFNMGQFLVRPDIDHPEKLPATLALFDRAVAELARRGGGVISTYYHPTEFVTTEFWDGVNFANGANPERGEWKLPRRRTAQSSEQAYRILQQYVEHAKSVPGVKFATAGDLPKLYLPPVPSPHSRDRIASAWKDGITFDQQASAADLLLMLLGMEHRYVDGPDSRAVSTYTRSDLPRAVFDRMRHDAADFIRVHNRLPAQVWAGDEFLSLEDFAATLAADTGTGNAAVRRGRLLAEKHISSESEGAFRWAIHRKGFQAPELLDLGRLQAWTLKPAVLR